MNEILALDLSIRSTGYCKAEADNPQFTITALGSLKTKLRDEHLKAGVKVVDREYTLQENIDQTLQSLLALGLQSQEMVFVVLEGMAFRASGDSASKLAELQGVIRIHLHWAKRLWLPVSPQTIKAHAIISDSGGGAKKGMVAMHARMQFADAILRWGQEITDDDQADSLVLCHLSWLFYRWSRELPITGYQLTKRSLDRLKNLQKANQ